MPSESDNLENRTIGLPPKVWAEMDKLSEMLGFKRAMVYRQVVREGLLVELQKLAVVMDLKNKESLSRKLSRWESEVDHLLSELKAIAGNDLALNHTENLQDTIARLEDVLKGDRHK